MNNQVIQHRRALHQIPELGFDLPKTHAYIRRVLTDAGYTVHTIAESGLYAVLEGHHPSAVLFRADMDALAMEENTNAPYTSLHSGAMHACGHDGHMAMVLAFAERMSSETRPDKTMIFLFQPAEESSGGARKVIEEGLFEQFSIEAVIGTHLLPDLDKGVFGLKAGVLMGEITEFSVFIEGNRGHHGNKESNHGAIIASAELIKQYYAMPKAMPEDNVLIGIGTIQGGDASNVIAGEITMEGTVRSYSKEAQNRMKALMQSINETIESQFGVQLTIKYFGAYPAVINHGILHGKIVHALASFPSVTMQPLLMADDFSFYGSQAPSYYIMLGTGSHGVTLHSERFDFDDTILIQGVQAYEAIACELGIINQSCQLKKPIHNTVAP